jgi:hypothetical protein
VKDEWKPLLVAIVLATCVGLGFGLAISPRAPWLPYEAAIENPGQHYDPSGYKTHSSTSSGSRSSAQVKFEGSLTTNPEHCYEDESEGECAARIVQKGISGFYIWLIFCSAISAIGAAISGWAISKQVALGRQQADLDVPTLFLTCRHNFRAVFVNPRTILYDTSENAHLSEMPSVWFRVRNYGGSPAVLANINAKVTGLEGFAPSIGTAYPVRDLPQDRVLGKGDGTDELVAALTNFKSMNPSRADYNELRAGRKFWWFTGNVSYDDVWGNRRVFHFCWQYDDGLDVFRPYPANRNYTQKLKRRHGAPPS